MRARPHPGADHGDADRRLDWLAQSLDLPRHATRCMRSPPAASRAQFSTATARLRSRVSRVSQATCGSAVTVATARSGWPGSTGSRAKTSRPAPASRPEVSASSSAASSTSAPRAVLIRMAPGLHRARRTRRRASPPSRASRGCAATGCRSGRAASPCRRSARAGRAARGGSSRSPSRRARRGPGRAGGAPPPSPTRPTVRPPISPKAPRHSAGTVQPSAPRRRASRRAVRRSVASISASVASATAAVLVPGMLQTAMPRARAAARSMVLRPTPIFWIRRSRGAASMTAPSPAAGRGTEPRRRRSRARASRRRARPPGTNLTLGRRPRPAGCASHGPAGEVEHRLHAWRPTGTGRGPGKAKPVASASPMRSPSFHLAMRSERAKEPTLSCWTPQPTARCDDGDVLGLARAGRDDGAPAGRACRRRARRARRSACRSGSA